MDVDELPAAEQPVQPQNQEVEGNQPAGQPFPDLMELLPLAPVPVAENNKAEVWEVPHPHPVERARRSAMNLLNFPNLVPLAHNLMTYLDDPRDRIRFLSTCRLFYNFMPRVSVENDQDHLRMMHVDLVRPLAEAPVLQIRFNDRTARAVPMHGAIEFLERMDRIFSKRMVHLRLGGPWADIKHYTDNAYDVGVSTEMSNLWERVCTHLMMNAQPKSFEIKVAPQTITQLIQFFANSQFSQRLEKLKIIYKTQEYPTSMTTALSIAFMSLATTSPHIRLQELQLDDRTGYAQMHDMGVPDQALFRNTLVPALNQLNLSALKGFRVNSLLGWADDDLKNLLERSNGFQDISLQTRQTHFNYDAIFTQLDTAITANITSLDLMFTSAESNLMILSLAHRFPKVRYCHLDMHNQPGELVIGMDDFQQQTSVLVDRIISMIDNLFETNQNDKMDLWVRAQGVHNRKIAEIISNAAEYAHLHVAHVHIHCEAWLMKMMHHLTQADVQQVGVPADGRYEYIRRPNTVRIRFNS